MFLSRFCFSFITCMHVWLYTVGGKSKKEKKKEPGILIGEIVEKFEIFKWLYWDDAVAYCQLFLFRKSWQLN